MRRGTSAPTVLALRGPGGWSGLPLRPLLGLADETLLLRLGQDDHRALDGRRELWRAAAPPGRGEFAGHRVQIGLAPRPPALAPPSVPALGAGPHLLVTDRPAQRTAALQAEGFAVVAPDGAEGAVTGVVVGSPGAWQARWQLLDRLRASVPVVVDRVAAGDLRTLLGRSAPLPPVDGPDDAVLLRPEAEPTRVRLPS